MSFNRQNDVSQLFLVRLRAESTGQRQQQPENKVWCGRVQHVVTGEVYDFRGWAELINRLNTMLDDTQADSNSRSKPPELKGDK